MFLSSKEDITTVTTINKEKNALLKSSPTTTTKPPNTTSRILREDQPASLGFTGISVADEQRLNRAFTTRKKLILDEIARHSTPPSQENDFNRDKSVKGFLDEKCIAICTLLNEHPDYITTSSCSGRISLFHSANEAGFSAVDSSEERVESNAAATITATTAPPPQASSLSSSTPSSDVLVDNQQQQGITTMKRGVTGSLGWVVVTHEVALTSSEVDALVDTVVRNPPTIGVASFKVEPFVMHVQCKTLIAAKELLTAALEAGFRNSGVIPPGKNIMVGIRHAGLSLDVPLVDASCPGMAPTEEYVRRLCELATSKMVENDRRIGILEKCIRGRIL